MFSPEILHLVSSANRPHSGTTNHQPVVFPNGGHVDIVSQSHSNFATAGPSGMNDEQTIFFTVDSPSPVVSQSPSSFATAGPSSINDEQNVLFPVDNPSIVVTQPPIFCANAGPRGLFSQPSGSFSSTLGAGTTSRSNPVLSFVSPTPVAPARSRNNRHSKVLCSCFSFRCSDACKCCPSSVSAVDLFR